MDSNRYRIDEWVDIPYEILNEYLNEELDEVPFRENRTGTKIKINQNISNEQLKNYLKTTHPRNRKLLRYRIVSHDSENFFRIYFNKSRYFDKFFTPKRELFKIEKDPEQKLLIINFFEKAYQRVFIEEFKGTTSIFLTIKRIAPPECVTRYLKLENYALVKIFSLKDLHKGKKKQYDLLVTFDPKIVELTNLYETRKLTKFSRKKEKLQKIYISRTKFSEFLQSEGDRRIQIPHKGDSEEEIEISLILEDYDDFLLQKKIYNEKTLTEVKENERFGRSDYYDHLYKYLKTHKTLKVEKKPKRENLNNLTIKEIELEKFDFSKDARLVRTIYGGKVKLIFLKKPCDILLSRDLDFTINPSLNILKKELDEQWDKGYREFLRDYSSELESKRIDDLSEKEVQSIQKKLTELRLLSNENFIDTFENIVVRSYYFFAVFKTFTDIFTEKYDIPRSEEFIREMMTNLALFNVFKYEFKTSPLINEETYFFDKLFLEKTKLQKERVRSLYNLSYQIIYLYLGVQRIRILGSVLEQRGVDREFVDKIEDLSHMIMKSTFMHMSTDTNLLAATCFASFVNVLDLRDKMPLIEIAEKAGIVQSMLNTKIVRLIEVDEEIFFENSKPIKSTKITTKLKDRLARALAREMFRFYYTILSREKRYKPSQANELINEFYNDFVFFKNNNLLFKDKGLTKVWKDIEKALERYQNILKKENSKRIEEISQSRIPLF